MATFTITSLTDTAGDTSTGTLDGSGNASGTLREAINFANANVANPSTVTTIVVAPGVNGTIDLAGNLPLVATSISFDGSGGGGLTINGGGQFRGFLISGIASDGQNAATTTVNLSNLTIQNVVAQGGNGGGGGGGGLGAGGAVFVGPQASVTLTNVDVSDASAVGGAGTTGLYGGGGGLGGSGGSLAGDPAAAAAASSRPAAPRPAYCRRRRRSPTAVAAAVVAASRRRVRPAARMA